MLLLWYTCMKSFWVNGGKIKSLCRNSSLWTAGLSGLWHSWENGCWHRDYPAEYWRYGDTLRGQKHVLSTIRRLRVVFLSYSVAQERDSFLFLDTHENVTFRMRESPGKCLYLPTLRHWRCNSPKIVGVAGCGVIRCHFLIRLIQRQSGVSQTGRICLCGCQWQLWIPMSK